MAFPEGYQFPLNAAGEHGQNSWITRGRIGINSSGLVGTAYGFPGFSATLVTFTGSTLTGVYNIKFPPVHDVEIEPSITRLALSLPTGLYPLTPTGATGSNVQATGYHSLQDYDVRVQNIGAVSGTAQLVTSRRILVGSGAYPSLTSVGAHLPSGAIINLKFTGHPVTKF